MNAKYLPAATKTAIAAFAVSLMTVAGSANALVAGVTGAFDETILLGVGAVVMAAVGIILLIRSAKKAGS